MATQASPGELVAHSNEDAVALFTDFQSAPELTQTAPLRLPFCLPQATTGANASFIRAYNEELQATGVEMNDWMHFIDGLNIAMTASPPLRVVDLAGFIIGFIPNEWAVAASAGMQIAAQTGIHILAKTLTDRLLRRANAEYFAPRGLCVRICKTAAMRQITGLDPPPDPTVIKSKRAKAARFARGAGRVGESVALHLPVIRRVYNRYASDVPVIESTVEGGITARRIGLLKDHTLPLSLDVPLLAPLNGLMDKASGFSMRLQVWAVRQREFKADRKRQLLAIQEGRAMFLTPRPSALSSSSSTSVVTQGWERRQTRKDARAEQKAVERGDSGQVSKRLREDVQIADRKEFNATDELLWVVLMTAEQDMKIQGRELVDSVTDVEVIPEEEWEEEIRHEYDEATRYSAGNSDETIRSKRL